MSEGEIEELIRGFEAGTWPRSKWTHEAHLLMGLWYVSRHGGEEGTRRIRAGITRYNAANGNLTGYHETITLAWVEVIERFLSRRAGGGPIAELAGEFLAEHGDRDYLLRHYTRERLMSEEAKHVWVEPDLAEFA